MKLSPTEAEKKFKVSRTTLYRDAKSGKVTQQKNDRGRTVFDVSELERVYEPRQSETSQNVTHKQSETEKSDNLLQVEIKGLYEQLAMLKDERDDLRRRLDAESEERRKLTALLTHEQQKKRSWFPFLK